MIPEWMKRALRLLPADDSVSYDSAMNRVAHERYSFNRIERPMVVTERSGLTRDQAVAAIKAAQERSGRKWKRRRPNRTSRRLARQHLRPGVQYRTGKHWND